MTTVCAPVVRSLIVLYVVGTFVPSHIIPAPYNISVLIISPVFVIWFVSSYYLKDIFLSE